VYWHRYILEALLMQLEEEATLMLTFDGVSADRDAFRLHQRHLSPFGLPLLQPDIGAEGGVRPVSPPLPAAAVIQPSKNRQSRRARTLSCHACPRSLLVCFFNSNACCLTEHTKETSRIKLEERLATKSLT
jgi:hypothetical protein